MSQNIINKIEKFFGKNSQVKKIELDYQQTMITLFYIESIIDKKLFSTSILAPIQKFMMGRKNEKPQNIFKTIKKDILSIYSIESIENLDDAENSIFSGNVLIVIDNQMMTIPMFDVAKRGIEEPPTSKVIKGPREGFVEDIFTNIGLIRKRMKTKNLQIKDFCIGKQTQTKISVIYLKGIARNDIVKKVEEKIKSINIDGIIDSYYVESFLEENKVKFFRRVGNTEKPDIVCAKLLEGRIAIIVDGSPIVITVPFVLFEDLQSSQDYYTIPYLATFVRVMRLFGLVFAILAPGVYVALQSYNYRILPINFLISILASIEGLSIPPIIEILIVLLLFEIITEASLQMPNSLGMALSIIGALALGNTAVDAGIISPPSIVVVAISSVALYIIPDEISQSRLTRVLFTIVGGIIGLYGILVSFIILITYMCSIKSFGVPYFVPYAPNIRRDKKDGFIKQDIQDMKSRPSFISGKNKTRQKTQKEKKV